MGRNFKCIVTDDAAQWSSQAAQYIFDLLTATPQAVITLPTGMTPLPLYQTWVQDYGYHQDVWQNLRFVALDEYVGLPADDERLFASWLARVCLDPLHIQNRTLFQSDAAPESEAQKMRKWLALNGPLDLAVLGLGKNGHVAFNEPGTAFTESVHVTPLASDTLQANARYWGALERVPQAGITLGLADLAQARHTVLLVTGAEKAQILKQALYGPVTTDIPASYLQTIENVTIIADRAAASLL